MNDQLEVPEQSQSVGLTGNPPIPAGQPMLIKSLGPGEREVLESAGWKDGDPVPDNIAAIADQAREDANNISQLQPPIDLTTPPLAMPEETDISDLPPAEQAKYMTIMQEVLTTTKEEIERQEGLQDSQVEGAGEGVNAAIQAAMSASSDVVVEDDTASDTYAGTEVSKDGQDKDKEDKPAGVCPRCAWNLSLDDPSEPSYQDKADFLQSILGLKPFCKIYSLFGGNMHVTVRSLQPNELDAIFRQLFMDAKADRILTAVDEGERLARYRTCLQVQKVTGGSMGFNFPESIDGWDLSAEERETPLPAIWDSYSDKVNKSEILHRSVMSAVGDFNQLMAKLESNSKNPDFWKAIDTLG